MFSNKLLFSTLIVFGQPCSPRCFPSTLYRTELLTQQELKVNCSEIIRDERLFNHSQHSLSLSRGGVRLQHKFNHNSERSLHFNVAEKGIIYIYKVSKVILLSI